MLIRLLGPVVAETDGGERADLGGVKQRAVLAQLALAPHEAVPVDRLAEGVWGERVPARYRQNLQVYVSTLRRALEPGRVGGGASRIVGHREAYELVVADDEVDATRLGRALETGRSVLAAGRPGAAAATAQAALADWRGTPMADLVGMPFAADHVDRLERVNGDLQEFLLEARLALGEHVAVAAELQDAVRAHPEREHLWELLAVALVRAGRQQDALDTLDRARRTLLEEYGLDPGPALRDLGHRVLVQDPGLYGRTPPALKVERIPVPLTPALGRDALVGTVEGLLRGDCRAVTLVGPGGVGKTRLALELAGRAPTGTAWWVPLADLAPTAEVAEAVAGAFGVGPVDLDDALDRAAQAAGTGAPLLVLDNLEHVLSAGPGLATLLARHPRWRALSTSRGPVGLPGEHVVGVLPLDPATTGAELFVARARALLPSFAGTVGTPAVRELVARLDGLPLAIELAAARVGVLDPRTLLDRLSTSLEDLRKAGAATGRQSSVAAAVQWSIDLLPPAARAALAALAVLDGTFGLPVAASAIGAATSPGAGAPADVADVVEALTRLALVQPLETGSGRRFALLQTVRAVARPSQGDAREQVLSSVGAQLLRDSEGRQLNRDWDEDRVAGLRDDLPVVRQVVDALLDDGRATDAARLVVAHRRGLAMLGRQDVLADLLERVLAAAPPPPWGARARVVAGSAAYALGRPEAATLLEAVEALDPADHPYRTLGSCFRTVLAADEKHHEGAATAAAEALAGAQASGDVSLVLLARSAAVWAAVQREDPAEALVHAQAAVDAAATGSDQWALVLALADLARAQLAVGGESAAEAVAVMQEAVQRARRAGLRSALPHAYHLLGYALVVAGDAVGGAAVLAESLAFAGGASDTAWALEQVAAVGLAAAAAGEREHGRSLVDRAASCGSTQAVASVVPPELRVCAAALGVVPDPAAVVLPPTVSDVVAEARALAAALAAAR